MSIVWVIERQKPEPAFHGLLGDFAVRVFASLSTFQSLVRLARRNPPSAVIVDAADVLISATELIDTIDASVPEVPIVLLTDNDTHWSGLDQRVYRAVKPMDPLALVTLVDRVIRGGRRPGSVLRYRDVVLDYERFACVVMQNEQAQGLPLKEAQLLKLFLQRPGVCLTRQQICEVVWAGVKVGPRTVDSHVSRLRKRLAGAETAIESVYGGGYVLR